MKLVTIFIGSFQILLVASLFAADVGSADWPQWRGPRRDGSSSETGLLKRWRGAGPKLIWQAAGLGDGYSSVVISGGSLFTIGKREGDVFAQSLDIANGALRWSTKIGTTSRNPSSTPTVAGDYVYALDPDGRLVCLRVADGAIVWQKHFVEDFGGKMMSGRGYGESPLIDGDRLICTPGGNDALIVALNRHTGETVWKTPAPEIGEGGRDGAGFSSIVISEGAGIRQYVQLVGRGLMGIAADDGRFLWGYNKIANGTANIPTPLVKGDLVFAANGYNAGCVLLRLLPDAPGKVKAEEVYFLSGGEFQNHHGGLVLVGDCVYGGHGNNNGLPTCLELTTGKILWKTRGPGTGSASIVYADGHLYFRYQDGVMALIEATTDGYKLKGTFEVPGSGNDSWAHPVVAGGRLYLREKDQLRVFDISVP